MPAPDRLDLSNVQWLGDAGLKQGDVAAKNARDAAEEARANAREARAAAAEKRAAEQFNLQYNAAPTPGDATKTGDAYLATIPATLAAQVKALAEGRRAFPTGTALKSPQVQELVAAATQYDPTLDAANAATRVKTRMDFTSGKSRQNVTALNTAIGHIAGLAKEIDSLGNTSIPVVNRFKNWAGEQLGDTSKQVALKRFEGSKIGVVGELAKVFKGGVGTNQDINEWRDQIDAADSPEALRAAVDKALEMLNSRLSALNDQYSTGMGKSSDPMELLSPHARELYQQVQSGAVYRAPEKRADVFGAPPPGAEIAGQGVKGFRYEPEQEQALLATLHSPQLDPAAFADQATQFAVANKAISPEGAAEFRAGVLANVEPYAKLPAQERARITNPVDYGNVDKAAMANAGLGTSLLTAAENIPESAANLVKGAAALPADLIASIASGMRVGTTKTFTDLATELAGKALGSKDAPTIDALTSALKDRYGSMDALKNTMVTDPVGIAGDLSVVLTGGGSAAARTGARLGATGLETAGRAVQTAGRVIDPLSAITALGENAPAIASRVPQGLRDIAVNAPTDALAFPSGVGGASLREGFGAGRERGVQGAPTARSTAFTQSMRDPGSTADDMVSAARDAVQNLRDAASQRYQAQMAQFGRQPVPLDISAVQQRMARIKPRNFDAMVDAPARPSEHLAWERMRDTVDHYAQAAQTNPALLEPLQMDAFKQDLYDVGSKVGGAYDRDAARIAGTAYNAVKDELVKHDPLYAHTMADYERAAREAQQLEGTFGLAAARNKAPNIDAAARRLQSIMRNNAATNYGRRAAQGERLNDLGAGDLMASLAGQSASSITPRGLRPVVEGPAGLTAMFLHPGTAAALPLFSPRAMGEIAYGAGRGVGAVERGVRGLTQSPVAQRSLDALSKAYNIYNDNPQAVLAAGVAGSSAKETERERLRRMYGVDIPEDVLNGQ